MKIMSNELVNIENKYPALAGGISASEEDALLREELGDLGGLTLKFPRIKLGASGNGKLEIPDANNPDESSSVKEFTGVIVCATSSRAKWAEGETIPECASSNGATSFNGKACSTCKYCKFSRDKDGAIIRPECKESRNIYLITETHAMPLHFIVPPSGIKTYNDFARDLLSSKRTQLGTIVKITVDVKVNKANQKYNCAKFESIGRVEADFMPKLMELRNSIKATIDSMSIEEIVDEDTMVEVKDDNLPF